jgi:hypothetical protein
MSPLDALTINVILASLSTSIHAAARSSTVGILRPRARRTLSKRPGRP